MFDERWSRIGRASEFMNVEGLEFRDYQFNIINSIFKHGNTLVVLPTGLGKTLIGVSIIADSLSKGRKALFLAPTRPLVEQHYSTLRSMLKVEGEEILLLVGTVNKKKRGEYEGKAKIIVATPQTVANDLRNGLFSLEDFGTVVFDECHRAVGKYAYTYIANESVVRDMLILGLTASPGSKKEKINALVDALKIRYIEARISEDEDVKRYVMPKYVHAVMVEKSERIEQIAGFIAPEAENSLNSLNKMGLLRFKSFERIPKGILLQAGDQITKISAQNYRMAAMFSYVKLLHLTHAYELLTTEGLYPFSKYFQALDEREKKSRSIESLLKNKNVAEARRLANEALNNGEEHSKVFAVLDTIKNYRGKSIIIFVQYRSTIKMLVEFVRNNGFSVRPFVGKREGITQNMQKATIMDFRNRKFDVLIASSIAEEGLDIPSVDVVLFYEPIPNEIRNIQRKGRTGRFRAGEVYILVAKGTKDEIYLYISRRREEKMLSLIKGINRKLEQQMNAQRNDTRQAVLNP